MSKELKNVPESVPESVPAEESMDVNVQLVNPSKGTIGILTSLSEGFTVEEETIWMCFFIGLNQMLHDPKQELFNEALKLGMSIAEEELTAKGPNT